MVDLDRAIRDYIVFDDDTVNLLPDVLANGGIDLECLILGHVSQNDTLCRCSLLSTLRMIRIRVSNKGLIAAVLVIGGISERGQLCVCQRYGTIVCSVRFLWQKYSQNLLTQRAPSL